MKKSKVLSVAVLVSFCTAYMEVAFASVPQWVADFSKGQANVSFLATGKPSALQINGKSQSVKGQLTVNGTSISGSVKLALQSLDTGISLRDRHMKEKYLEVEKYPEAVLNLTNVTVPDGKSLDTDFDLEQVAFEGTLQLHGVTHPVRGQVSVQRKKNELKLMADFGVRLTDYAITLPSFAGITVADEVKVQVAGVVPCL